MNKIEALLFDFDGVIVNTEPEYDVFFDNIGIQYGKGDHFAAKVKGVTLSNIIKIHFSDLSKEEQQAIEQATISFELEMPFPLMEGAANFLMLAKEKGFKTALVTSSNDKKIKRALNVLALESYFDTIITSNDIVDGKPNPACYLLAAKKLGVQPQSCVVFEDSKAGIQAGKSAEMFVIGLSTTLPEAEIKEKVNAVIPNFANANDILKEIDGFT